MLHLYPLNVRHTVNSWRFQRNDVNSNLISCAGQDSVDMLMDACHARGLVWGKRYDESN